MAIRGPPSFDGTDDPENANGSSSTAAVPLVVGAWDGYPQMDDFPTQ
ncbi:hypothetical protein [Natronorubrum tibetense]|nr:hypothetical protein [Natronorubrum tibetense]